MKKSPTNHTLTFVVTTIWITFSEFVRNEFLFKQYWVDHYSALKLTFQTLPINGVLWMVWSAFMAYFIYKLLQKCSFIETVLLTWLGGFVMMWITTYNLQVLPLKLLIFAVPLSLLEVFVAAKIINLADKDQKHIRIP